MHMRCSLTQKAHPHMHSTLNSGRESGQGLVMRVANSDTCTGKAYGQSSRVSPNRTVFCHSTLCYYPFMRQRMIPLMCVKNLTLISGETL